MKKLSFFLFLFFAANLMHSQITLSPNFGANISTVRFKSDHLETKPVLRYFLGLQASHDISPKFVAGLGLQYVTKGYRSGETNILIFEETKYKYLELAPFVEYKLKPKIGLLAGGSVGFKLDEKFIIEDGWESRSTEFVKPIDLSAMVGMKYSFNNVFISLRYQQSLVTISDIVHTDGDGNEISNTKHLNQNLLLGVGYNFHLH